MNHKAEIFSTKKNPKFSQFFADIETIVERESKKKKKKESEFWPQISSTFTYPIHFVSIFYLKEIILFIPLA